MEFKDYEEKADLTAVYPDRGNNIYYPVLGLCGESGEVAEKVKKIMRDKEGIITDKEAIQIVRELGDVLWYLSAVAFELGFDLDEVARLNIEKLESRKRRDKLKGSGDER